MAVSGKERKQILVLLIVVAVAAAYLFWTEWRASMVARADAWRSEIDSLRAQVDSARQDLREGTVEQLRRRVDGFERSLGTMRLLVPAGNEVPNLIDDISTRAQLRAVEITEISPLSRDFVAPFEVYRYRLSVIGSYDALGEFLSDIASLPRIMVPYDLALQIAPATVAESSDEGETVLSASFQLRTYVKPSATADAGEGVGNGAP
jgi:type IV pilus assembly protein PilO